MTRRLTVRWRALANSDASLSETRTAFVVALVAFYVGVFFFLERLQLSPTFDEPHYWGSVLEFSHRWIPSLEQLRTYRELNTPLAFVIFGWLEYGFHAGIFAGRLLNLVTSFVILLWIGLSSTKSRSAAPLAVLGLVISPHYLRMGGYLYTDMMAAFFVFLGVWLYLRGQHWWAALAFVLAIATRQYVVAFPAGIVLYELIRGYPKMGLRPRASWIAPLVASASLVGWIWFFGGLVPQNAMTNPLLTIPRVQKSLINLDARAGLYLLASLGLLFVIPEWVLFNQSLNWRSLLTKKSGLLGLGLLLLFWQFPILKAHGVLIRFMKLMPTASTFEAAAFFLAWLAAIRFSRMNLGLALVAMNLAVLLKAYPWDKYLLPLLVVLWFFRAATPEHIDEDLRASASVSPPIAASSAPLPA